jgi:STE24 endopeptidase
MARRAILKGLAVVFLMSIPILPQTTILAQELKGDSTSGGVVAQASPESTSEVRNRDVQGYKLSPDKYARAVAYCRGEYWLYFVTTAYTLLLLWAAVRWRLGPRLRDWTEGISRRAWVQLLLYAPTLLLIFGVFLLPTDSYDQWLKRKYGLSVQGWTSWIGDWTAGEMATLLAGTLTIGLVYFTMRRSTRRWWLWLWAIGWPLLVLFALIQPVFIDPWFNTLEPLGVSHPELVDTIKVLLARAGPVIPPEHFYLLKGGDKSIEVDASSEGFGPTKRVFVWDTAIAAEPGPLILHTLGHEMGHYTLLLDRITIAICIPLSLGVLYIINRLLVQVLARWGDEWHIRGPDDWASVPALAFIVVLIVVAFTPGANTISRYREHECDRYGLEVIHGIVPNSGEVAAQAFQVEGEINLQDPDPPAFIAFWLFDHPPLNERIVFCRAYDPWSNGQKPRYVQ